MMESLNIKDLITVGIFSVINIILIFTFGMLGYIPILMLGLPIIGALVWGIPFMLFLTRVNKFGMITLMGLIIGIVMFLSGHTWIPIIVYTITGLIADIIIKTKDYSSIKTSIIGYAVFAVGLIGNMLPFFILRDYYISAMNASMGAEYVNFITPFLQYHFLIILIILTFIAGLLSGYIGKLVLKKHFEKAGMA
jgi:energy-coupling factor transport system substrate-specific component